MKTFKASYVYEYEITEYDVIKETTKFITYVQKGLNRNYQVRELKQSAYLRHFKHYEEAKKWLIYQIDSQISNFQIQLEALESQKQKLIDADKANIGS